MINLFPRLVTPAARHRLADTYSLTRPSVVFVAVSLLWFAARKSTPAVENMRGLRWLIGDRDGRMSNQTWFARVPLRT